MRSDDERPDGERPWQEVQRMKSIGFSRPNIGGGRREDPRQTTFYVANLPNGTKDNDLENRFDSYGKVADAYVAAKRDRSGGLFGFVRFTGVADKWETERSLSMVNLNNARLFVNLAKFDRGGKTCFREKIKVPLPSQVGQPLHYREAGYKDLDRGNKSSRDVLLKNQSILHPVLEVTVRDDADIDAIQCESSRPSPFPDLNSQILRSPQDEHGNSELVGVGGGNRIDNIRSTEVGETINMGKELGVNLENLEELVRTVIEGEMET
ncbi:hypothetical protein L1987_17069 [Smallanthus sonchifolius]|uniref:Uncharacterized protein n=1 Tax=Smallanthus sonchifolius TaxID=185202 RepID=A0ACB9IW90_9ASTR|nr:hypothetical protein L1987_17069 [Smallanthus sonchifolius]